MRVPDRGGERVADQCAWQETLAVMAAVRYVIARLSDSPLFDYDEVEGIGLIDLE